MLKIQNIRCENKINPINIADEIPKFSWILFSNQQNVCQTGYQIKIWEGSKQIQDLGKPIWDTGKVESSATYGIQYEGQSLKSRSCYCYQVISWDNQGEVSESEMQFFETTVFDYGEWKAKFIEPERLPLAVEENPLQVATAKWQEFVFKFMRGEPTEYLDMDAYYQTSPFYPYYPAVMMYRCFQAKSDIARARLYMTAHGVYEFYLNGQKTTDTVLAPEFTTYDKLLKYQVYDVTDALNAGENAIGVVIADGWFKGKIANGRGCEYGDNPALFMELEITYQNGDKETIYSDKEFVYSYDSPYVRADIFNGETYDARKKIANFASVDMDTKGWNPVHTVDLNLTVLTLQKDAPIRAVAEIEPKELYQNANGEIILDMGQNFAGCVRITDLEGVEGTEIILEHTEELAPDGSFTYPFSNNGQAQKDIYIFSGSGNEMWEPAFTYHGFRYVKITGEGSKPWRKEQFKGIVISSANEKAGEFHCSDEKIDRLQENVVWSQLSNMIGTPTDCPTREKAGWTGDVVVYGKTACFNQSLLEFYKDWLKSIRAEQLVNGVVQNTVPLIKNYIQQLGMGSSGWGDVIITLPWDLYQIYGDKSVLEENYDAMKKWMNYLETLAYVQLPPESEGLTGDDLDNQHYLLNTGFHFGDWLVPSVVNEDGFADAPKSSFLTGYTVSTALFAADADMLCTIAGILKDVETEEKYRILGQKIRKAFEDTYLLSDGKLQNDLQGLYVMALQMNMVSDEKREGLLNRLLELIDNNGGCMDTGFMSVPYILDVLSDNGRKDEAYKLLYQNQCPSWLYEVEHGATTVWESWNAIKPDGSKDGCSFNHYAFGCVGNWMYKNLLGIKNDGIAYEKILIEPGFDSGLEWAKGYYDSVHGRISVEWKKTAGEIICHVEIPVNAQATIQLGKDKEIKVGSGSYEFALN